MQFFLNHFSIELPPNHFELGDGYDDNTRVAYDHCLWLEQFDSWNTFADELQNTVSEDILADMPPIVAARVLGYAMRYTPNDCGRDALVHDILACEKNPELLGGLAHL